MKSILLALYFLLSTTIALYGQNNTRIDTISSHQILIKQFTHNDGLPIQSLGNMHLGTDRILTISTLDGLVRFNGSTFNVYNTSTNPEFESDRILDAISNADSSIWLLNDRNELLRWDRFRATTIGISEGLPSTHINHFIHDGENKLWVATNFGIVYQQGKASFKTFNRDFRLAVWSILPISNTSVLAMTNRGLYNVTPFNVSLILPASDSLFVKDKRVSFLKTKDKGFLVGTYNGIIQLDSNFTIKAKRNLGVKVYNIYELHNQENQYLAQTQSYFYQYNTTTSTAKPITNLPNLTGGLFKRYDIYWNDKLLLIGDTEIYHGGKHIFTSPDYVNITGAVVDSENNLWVSTNGRGLFRLRYSLFNTIIKNNEKQSINTYSIYENKLTHSIWFATLGTGLYEITPNSSLKRHRLPGIYKTINHLRSILFTKKNELFLSTWGDGVFYNSNSKWKKLAVENVNFANPYNIVDGIFEDNFGRIWLGGLEGLFVLDSLKQKITEIRDSIDTPIQNVRVFHKLPNNQIIVGTKGYGALIIDSKTDFTYSFNPKYSGLFIRDIYSTNPDTLWFATEDKGLIRTIATKNGYKSESFIYPDVIKSNSIHKILADSYGYWWITNNHGLFRINKSELDLYLDHKIKTITVQHFTDRDGLSNREMNGGTSSSGIVDSKGFIWLPTQTGISWFNPANFVHLKKNKQITLLPQTIHSAFNTYIISTDNTVFLKSNERTVQFKFDALHYTNPENLTFSYALDSDSLNWFELGNNRVLALSNLHAGENVVSLKLTNSNFEGKTQTKIKLFVEPYFFEAKYTKIAFTFITPLMLILGYVLYRKKNKTIDNDAVIKDSLNPSKEYFADKYDSEYDKSELIKRVKTETLNNIAHELRTPISLVKGPIEYLIDVTKHGKPFNLEEQLKRIHKYSKVLDILLEKISDLIKAPVTDELASQIYQPEETILENKVEYNETLLDKKERPLLLLVDDNDDYRNFLNLSLSHDYRIVESSNPLNALILLETLQPNLIISDIMMPELNGIEFARRVFQIPGKQHIPLIFISANSSNQSIHDGLKSGALAYLSKPISLNVLKAQVKSLLNREKNIPLKTESIENTLSPFILKVRELIFRHLGDPSLSLETLAEAMHMSKSTLYRKWKEESDELLNNFIIKVRLEETISLVKEQGFTLAEASLVCGFSNPSYFSRAFKKTYNCTPSEYLENMNKR